MANFLSLESLKRFDFTLEKASAKLMSEELLNAYSSDIMTSKSGENCKSFCFLELFQDPYSEKSKFSAYALSNCYDLAALPAVSIGINLSKIADLNHKPYAFLVQFEEILDIAVFSDNKLIYAKSINHNELESLNYIEKGLGTKIESFYYLAKITPKDDPRYIDLLAVLEINDQAKALEKLLYINPKLVEKFNLSLLPKLEIIPYAARYIIGLLAIIILIISAKAYYSYDLNSRVKDQKSQIAVLNTAIATSKKRLDKIKDNSKEAKLLKLQDEIKAKAQNLKAIESTLQSRAKTAATINKILEFIDTNAILIDDIEFSADSTTISLKKPKIGICQELEKIIENSKCNLDGPSLILQVRLDFTPTKIDRGLYER